MTDDANLCEKQNPLLDREPTAFLLFGALFVEGEGGARGIEAYATAALGTMRGTQ